MRSRRPWTLCRAFWMLLAVVLLVPALALGQTETGRISGTAMDEQGGVLPGATITATNVGTGVSRSAVTDSNGRFVFTNLQPGTYEISAELAGFAKNSGQGHRAGGRRHGVQPEARAWQARRRRSRSCLRRRPSTW